MSVPFPSPPLIFSILLPGCLVPLGFLGFWIPSIAQLQSSKEETQVPQIESDADGWKTAQKTSRPQGEEEDSSVFYPLEEGLELPSRTLHREPSTENPSEIPLVAELDDWDHTPPMSLWEKGRGWVTAGWPPSMENHVLLSSMQVPRSFSTRNRKDEILAWDNCLLKPKLLVIKIQATKNQNKT